MERLVEVCEPEVRIEFALNCKCRATVRLRSLTPNAPVAFKVQTSSPNKFLVNPPSGLVPPLSSTAFQVILKPQPHVPRAYPRSPSDRFLIKTAEFVPSNSSAPTHPDSVNAWFASRPYGFSTQDIKLKVAFVGPVLLRDAVSRGDLDVVRNLIKRQRSVLADLSLGEAESLLRVATELVEPEDMVHVLLEAGLRVHEEAVGSEKVDGSDVVDVAGGDIVRDEAHKDLVDDLEQGEAVLEAARRGDVRQLESLLQRGEGVSYRDHYGLTALHAAAFKGHKDVVLRLSEVAGLECQDEEGHVPLHMAVESGDIETVRVLVSKGVNLNAVNKKGATPLYMASVWGYDDICELLVSKGALSSLPETSP